MDDFNNNPDIFCFLLTTKVGVEGAGLGLDTFGACFGAAGQRHRRDCGKAVACCHSWALWA
jgi:hypothetical protein